VNEWARCLSRALHRAEPEGARYPDYLVEAPAPANGVERVAHWAGIRPADGLPPSPPQRLESLDPVPARSGKHKRKVARRIGLTAAAVIGIGLTALAAQKIGVDEVVESIVRSDLTWVLVACALMALSLFFRAASWYWIVRAALPLAPVRRRDVTSAPWSPRRCSTS